MDKQAEQIKELQIRNEELKRLNHELKVANAKLLASVEEYRKKEQTISSAIIASMEHANQLEASRKKLYTLDIQRSRLMYLRMEQIINELYIKYPELRKDMKLRDMSERFKSMVYSDLNDKVAPSAQININKTVTDDPIKKLLRNIIDCFDTKKPEPEVKSITPMANLMEAPATSGFDFNEALHPTMELDEILKVFNLGKKEG